MSRRTLLGGFTVLAIAPASALATQAAHPDAALLAACADHMKLAAEEDRLLHAMHLHPAASREPAAVDAEKAWNAGVDRASDALAIIMGMKAAAMEGAAAKGRSVLAYRRSIADPGETDAVLDFHERAALSVLRDLERLAGGAA